jgi:hypothetical protein
LSKNGIKCVWNNLKPCGGVFIGWETNFEIFRKKIQNFWSPNGQKMASF